MAEILIRGLSIPKEGFINLSVQSEGLTMLTATSTFNEKTGWFEWQKCDHTMHETIELPEHGDLIDRDAFDADARKRYCSACDNYNGTKCRACWVDDMLGDVADFEAVIPSTKGGTE